MWCSKTYNECSQLEGHYHFCPGRRSSNARIHCYCAIHIDPFIEYYGSDLVGISESEYSQWLKVMWSHRCMKFSPNSRIVISHQEIEMKMEANWEITNMVHFTFIISTNPHVNICITVAELCSDAFTCELIRCLKSEHSHTLFIQFQWSWLP